mgnify:CR=1 FL=1
MFDTIVVATDGSDSVRRAVDVAVDGDGDRETVCVAVRLLRDADGTDEFEESAAPPICEVTLTGRTSPNRGPKKGPRTPGGPTRKPEAETRTVTHDVEPPLTRTRGKICTPSDENGGDGTRPGIDSITVSTCGDDGNGDDGNGGDGGNGGDDGNGDDGNCVPCESGSDARVGGATFEYDGPSGSVTVVIDQQSNGNSPQGTVTVEDVAPGDTLTVPIAGNGQPEFDLSVRDPDGKEWSIGTVHTSCSQPFGPGTTVTDGTRTLTVLEAVTKDGTSICEVSDS